MRCCLISGSTVGPILKLLVNLAVSMDSLNWRKSRREAVLMSVGGQDRARPNFSNIKTESS